MRGRLKRFLASPVVVLAVAVAWGTWLAMFVAKLMGLWVQLESEFGRTQLFGDSPVLNTLGLWWQDFLAAAIWGVAMGLCFGWARSTRRRWVARAARATFGFMLACLLTVATVVYQLFASPPNAQMLDGLLGAGDTGASVEALIGAGTITMWLFFIVTIGVLPEALVSRLGNDQQRATIAAGSFCGLWVLFTGFGLWAPPNPTELDKNGLVNFTHSTLIDAKAPAGEHRPGKFTSILTSIAGRPDKPAPSRAYQRLATWLQQKPRNIVLVILEGAAPEHLQLFGGKHANTPTLVRMAKQGILWPRHYAHAPNSMSAIYSILCANYGRPGGSVITVTAPRINCRAASELLAKSGMRTGLWHSSYFHSRRKNRFLEGRAWDQLHDVRTLPIAPHHWRNSWGVEESVVIDEILAWAKRPASKPFFATYIPVQTHHPYTVLHPRYRKFSGTGDLANYINVFFYMDQMISRLVDGLDKAGLGDETLIIVVGDHGEAFGKHPGSRMHGGDLYDENVRSFALWHAPGALDSRHNDARPMGHVDLVPTLMSLMGKPRTPSHPGMPANAPGPRQMIPLYTMEGRPHRGFVDGDVKFVFNVRTGLSELYNLAEDPGEQRSLPGTQAQLSTYRARALQFLSARATWEKSLGMLSEKQPKANVSHVWSTPVTSCKSHKPGDFEIGAQHVKKLKPGAAVLVCELVLSEKSAQLVGVVLKGHDAAHGTRAIASVSYINAAGKEREIAYGTLDGTPDKPMADAPLIFVARRDRLEGGGTLKTHIRWEQSNMNASLGTFSVAGLEFHVSVAVK